ncbi:hypothetical protein BDZ91DRAFT_406219 [Kalaharituber pfeilii]|nr:hypothetical protein BDZ91DRAFT_406219 [Kalaharituber pfeilii]
MALPLPLPGYFRNDHRSCPPHPPPQRQKSLFCTSTPYVLISAVFLSSFPHLAAMPPGPPLANTFPKNDHMMPH